jgi:hypothetical protein
LTMLPHAFLLPIGDSVDLERLAQSWVPIPTGSSGAVLGKVENV